MARTVEVDFSNIPQPPKTFPLSPQQVSIMDAVEHGTDNLLVIAVAGAGKTTTLIEALSRMLGSIAFAAYNKRISEEIKEKVTSRNIGSNVDVKTFHAFGYAAWRNKYRKTQIDADKIRNIVNRLKVNRRDERKLLLGVDTCPAVLQEFVQKLVSLVRSEGIGVVCPINSNDAWEQVIAHHGLEDLVTGKKPWDRDEPDLEPEDIRRLVDEGKKWAMRVLRESIRVAVTDQIIDFDDQLFMPMYEKLYIQQYDWVLIDEAQDSNAMRRAMAAAMLKPGGRLMAVGDPMQAIYGFAGADSASLDRIREQFQCVDMPLTVSYRCPKRIIIEAQEQSSIIEAAVTADEGYVGAETIGLLNADVRDMSDLQLEESVILCRKNAPLAALAFSYIRERIPCHVEGRDIGQGLITLATKWQSANTLYKLIERVREYKDKKVKAYLAKNQNTQADSIADRCNTIMELAGSLLRENEKSTIQDLVKVITDMFKNDERRGLTLCSVHKSKGREWKYVYLLGRDELMPSPFATIDWQLEQENNLIYVAVTRAQKTLVYVSLDKESDESAA